MNPITDHATKLANELISRIAQYNDGLICAAEFINECTIAAAETQKACTNCHCNMRITNCETYVCPAIKTPGSETETAGLLVITQLY